MTAGSKNIFPLFFFFLASCNPSAAVSTSPPPAPAPSDASESQDPSFANGWSEVTIMANYAKTTVDSVAHFATSRNACGKDAFGTFELKFWNTLVKNINESIAATPLTDDSCFPAPDVPKPLDGTVEVSPSNSTTKVLLFDARGGDICTHIPDLALAHRLLDEIDEIILLADREECPNGWGSG